MYSTRVCCSILFCFNRENVNENVTFITKLMTKILLTVLLTTINSTIHLPCSSGLEENRPHMILGIIVVTKVKRPIDSASHFVPSKKAKVSLNPNDPRNRNYRPPSQKPLEKSFTPPLKPVPTYKPMPKKLIELSRSSSSSSSSSPSGDMTQTAVTLQDPIVKAYASTKSSQMEEEEEDSKCTS